MTRKYHKVLKTRYRPGLSLGSISIFLHSDDKNTEIFEKVFKSFYSDYFNINAYHCGSRTPEVYRVYTNDAVKDFGSYGEAIEYIESIK